MGIGGNKSTIINSNFHKYCCDCVPILCFPVYYTILFCRTRNRQVPQCVCTAGEKVGNIVNYGYGPKNFLPDPCTWNSPGLNHLASGLLISTPSWWSSSHLRTLFLLPSSGQVMSCHLSSDYIIPLDVASVNKSSALYLHRDHYEEDQ